MGREGGRVILVALRGLVSLTFVLLKTGTLIDTARLRRLGQRI